MHFVIQDNYLISNGGLRLFSQFGQLFRGKDFFYIQNNHQPPAVLLQRRQTVYIRLMNFKNSDGLRFLDLLGRDPDRPDHFIHDHSVQIAPLLGNQNMF